MRFEVCGYFVGSPEIGSGPSARGEGGKLGVLLSHLFVSEQAEPPRKARGNPLGTTQGDTKSLKQPFDLNSFGILLGHPLLHTCPLWWSE